MKLGAQITALQKKRLSHLDDMQGLSDAAAKDQRLFSIEEQRAFAAGEEAVTSIDNELDRLRSAEQRMALTARPAELPGGLGLERSKSSFKGQAFTRFVGALALSKGNLLQANEIAARWSDTPEVAHVLQAAVKLGSTADPFWLGKAAVAVGTTTDPAWASPLVAYSNMASEFIDLLRPATVVGRLSLRPAPFMVKIPRATAGSSAGWVGEGLSKPVSRLSLDMVQIPFAKIAVIVVITQELARFSTPSAEQLVQADLIAAIAQFIDQQFLDPAVTPLAGVRPGSITNAAPTHPSTGSSVAAVTTDLSAAMLALSNALGGNIGNPCWVMSPAASLFLSTLRTAQDVFAFPGMGMGSTGGIQPGPGSAQVVSQGTGRTLMGLPVVVSGNVPVVGGLSDITLLDQNEILLADDGQVLVDTSSEASVQMDTAPATPPTPLVSLWQQNLLGIKAERFIYWLARRSGVVQVITGFPAATP